jgi:hypothetical protein
MDEWWEERTLPQRILLGTGLGIAGIGLVFLFGWIVMLLWNWLMPEIFGLKQLTYWQAWGILILSCILFKNCNFSSKESGSRHHRKRRAELKKYMREENAVEGATDSAHTADRADTAAETNAGGRADTGAESKLPRAREKEEGSDTAEDDR